MTSSNQGFALRGAHAEDAERIARLHTESWRRTYRGMMTDEFLDGGALDNRRSVWHERLHTPGADQYVCVAEDGSTLIGFICGFADHDPVWGSYIDNLHVVYASHRRGVGRALMRNAAEWFCRVRPDRGVYLWVMEANAPARVFYEHLGATNVGTTDMVDPGGGHAPNCRYVWASPRLLLGE
jgi:ribosomal protein S18 acetylase RimI-like enzyme